jgi:hypothetical protein
MATVIRVCRKCGTKILSDAPERLCTGCVLETALAVTPATIAVDDDRALWENAAANNTGIERRA